LSSEPSTAPAPPGWRLFPAERIAVLGARLFDPASGLDRTGGLVIENGVISRIGDVPPDFDGEVIEGNGLIVCPGLFDMHVHLREPGFEYKETVRTGCLAAIVGGFTGVAPMPNTTPPIDNPGVVDFIRRRARELPVEVHPIAAVTLGREGRTLAELAELHEAGVTAFSDDGAPVANAYLMRLALEYSRMLDAVIIEHCEERSLTAEGVVDEGMVSTELGLPGWPAVGEEIAVERAVRLAEFTGGRLHIAHISTAGAVQIVRRAKQNGVKVTAEVTPHHLTLDSEAVRSFDTDFKVNPPLRTPADIEALTQGLAEGVIDAVATDHAPHAAFEKEIEFIEAPFGMIGLETALGVILTKLVAPGRVPLARAIDALTAKPRRILGLPPVELKTGAPANLTLIDPEEKWTVDRTEMVSRSRNTPFHGWRLVGRARGVINRNLACLRGG